MKYKKASKEDIEYASMYCHDQYIIGEPGFANPETLDWFIVPNYPIERLVDKVDLEWFTQERKMWLEEGQPERFNDMINNPIIEEIIIYDNGIQGYTWDGNHRVGATLYKGLTSIKAIVGIKKGTIPQF